MSFFDSMNIVGSAMTAERFRMDVALQNIANANTTRTESGEPYRRKQVVFQERAVDFEEPSKMNRAVWKAAVCVSRKLWKVTGILYRYMTPAIPMPMRKAMSSCPTWIPQRSASI